MDGWGGKPPREAGTGSPGEPAPHNSCWAASFVGPFQSGSRNSIADCERGKTPIFSISSAAASERVPFTTRFPESGWTLRFVRWKGPLRASIPRGGASEQSECPSGSGHESTGVSASRSGSGGDRTKRSFPSGNGYAISWSSLRYDEASFVFCPCEGSDGASPSALSCPTFFSSPRRRGRRRCLLRNRLHCSLICSKLPWSGFK